MAYKYEYLIPQNIASKGAKSIGVYDGNGKKVCSIPLGRLTPPTKQKLYSFGLLSDVHLENYRSDPISSYDKFDKALSFFKEQGASFCCHCGDVTDYGFWFPSNTYEKSTYDPSSYEELKRVCEKYNIRIYGNCGNHESYNGYDITGTYADTYGADPTLVISNLEKLQEYTGNGLFFEVNQNNDVFIFVGQPSGNKPMNDTELQWLRGKLDENKNKRCFIFVHPPIGVGNPANAYDTYKIFYNWADTTEFKNLLKSYPNTILFHGHTHTIFESQKMDREINYSTKDGFKSIHVPSLANGRTPTDIVNGTLTEKDIAYSQGYIVDVYDDCIVLNGMDLINNEPVPLGTYKIDTA